MHDCAKGLLLFLLIALSMKPAAALAVQCLVGEPFAYEAPYDLEECPPDIQTWMDRANGCAHIQGEFNGDKSPRDEALNDQWIDMECDYLQCDYHDLLKKYKGNGVMTNIIEEYKKIVYGEGADLVCTDQ